MLGGGFRCFLAPKAFLPSPLPPRWSHSQISSPPTPCFLCATGDPPASLAADNLVSDSLRVLFCVHLSPRIWVRASPWGLVHVCPGSAAMRLMDLVHISQPVPRLNSTFAKSIISKLPTFQGCQRGRQYPEAFAITALGASSPHPQGGNSPGQYQPLNLPPDTARALWACHPSGSSPRPLHLGCLRC